MTHRRRACRMSTRPRSTQPRAGPAVWPNCLISVSAGLHTFVPCDPRRVRQVGKDRPQKRSERPV